MSQNDFSNKIVLESELISPKHLLKALSRHPIVFVAVFFAVILLSVAYIVRFVPVYRATVTIEIEPEAASVLGRGVEIYSVGSGGSYWANKNYYATQYEIIKSFAVSSKVIGALPPDKMQELAGDAGKDNTIQQVNSLRGRISVMPQKNSNIARISVDDSDPLFAAFLADEVTQAYLDFNIEKKYLATKSAASWLLEQSINLKKQLEESELAVFDFKKEHRILSTTFESKKVMLSTKISAISDSLTKQEMVLKSQEAFLKELEDIDFSDVENFFLSDVTKNRGMIQSLKLSYLKLTETYRDKLIYYGDKHPEIISLQDRLKEVREALLREIKGVKENLSLEMRTTKSSLKKLRGMLFSVQKEMVALSKLEITHSKLKREVETNNKLYDMVLERTKKADLSTMLKTHNIRIIDRAQVPFAPIKPRKKIIMLIGLLLALLLSTAVVLGMELFARNIRDIDELEQITGKSIVGFVPKCVSSQAARQIFFDGEKHSPAVEAIRTLRTNLYLADLDSDIFTLLVTSAVPKEGKTTIAGNVAIAFANAGKKVVLVDTDMRRPQIHRMFDVTNKQGITTLLLGDATLDEVVYHDTAHSGLDVIVCGPVSPTPQEMISSHKFEEFITNLKNIYEVVILDSPPISASADAVLLSTMVDATLLVSRLEYERRDLMRYSIKALNNVGTKILGVVVNGVDGKKGYYSNYYGYSYTAQDDASQERDDA